MTLDYLTQLSEEYDRGFDDGFRLCKEQMNNVCIKNVRRKEEMTLEQTQDIIADESFEYKGNSLEMIDIVNAIKAGYRLSLPNNNNEEDSDD